MFKSVMEMLCSRTGLYCLIGILLLGPIVTGKTTDLELSHTTKNCVLCLCLKYVVFLSFVLGALSSLSRFVNVGNQIFFIYISILYGIIGWN